MDLVGKQIGKNIRIVGLLEAGGMGEVYVGVDERLGRRVAVKTVHASSRLEPQARARALREARILSQLEHPFVNRIYDYIEGEDSDFLVLELIEGTDLREIIKPGLESSLVLGIAEQVAQALAAAHAKGVVHRDLKPANVMVTTGNRVKVLDFGVATLVGEGQGRREPEEGHGPADHTGGSEAQRQARTDASDPGLAGGTIAYMSPEQVQGEPATAASDMFSFGLLLQQLATGRPPYDPRLRGTALLVQVAEGASEPVTGIDQGLAELVNRLKSLAPGARPTALETVERLRWIRDAPRRRRQKIMAAVAIAVISLAGLKYTLDLRRERLEAVEARQQAEALVDFMVEDLYEGLRGVGRVDLLDKVASETLEYYESVPRRLIVGDTLHRRGTAFRHVGLVLETRGELEAAHAAYEQALAIARQLVERDPKNIDWQHSLQQSYNYRADNLEMRGELDPALQDFGQAVAIGRRLQLAAPDHVAAQEELAWSLNRIGDVLAAQDRAEAALVVYGEALEVADRLAGGDPDSPERLQSLAETRDRLGVALTARGDLDAAVAELEDSLAIHRRLVDADPGNVEWQVNLSMSLDHLGGALQAADRLAEARQAYESALAIDSWLASYEPRNAEWRNNLAWSHVRLGHVYAELGQPARARQTWERALATIEAFPIELEDLYTLDTRVKALLALGRVTEARPVAERLLEEGWTDHEFLELCSRHGFASDP